VNHVSLVSLSHPNQGVTAVRSGVETIDRIRRGYASSSSTTLLSTAMQDILSTSLDHFTKYPTTS